MNELHELTPLQLHCLAGQETTDNTAMQLQQASKDRRLQCLIDAVVVSIILILVVVADKQADSGNLARVGLAGLTDPVRFAAKAGSFMLYCCCRALICLCGSMC